MVGVALFRPSNTEGYQWGFVTHASSWRAPDVNIYQITDRDVRGSRIPWTESFQTIALNNLPNLMGIIHIGPVDASVSDLEVFIRELGAKQERYDTRGRGWNCGTYVLQIVENLIDAGMIETTFTPQELLLEGEVLAARLEQFGSSDAVPIINVSWFYRERSIAPPQSLGLADFAEGGYSVSAFDDEYCETDSNVGVFRTSFIFGFA